MPWRKGNKLKLVPEDQAQGRTEQVYGEIKQALGIPFVDFVYQVYAAYPVFLDLHWRTLQRIVRTEEFFSLARRLQADSYTRLHSYFDVPDLCDRIAGMEFSSGARQEVTQVVDLFHNTKPILLLIVAAQFQCFDSAVGSDAAETHPASPRSIAPMPILIDEDSAPPPTRRTYDDIKHTLELPFVPTVFRAFARWPDFIVAYWDSLKGVLQSPVYEGCHYGVRETAFALTRELPCTLELTLNQLSEAGLKDEEIASLVRINEVFMRVLSALVLDVAFAKIAIDGGSSRTTSKTTATQQPAISEEPESVTNGDKTEQAA